MVSHRPYRSVRFPLYRIMCLYKISCRLLPPCTAIIYRNFRLFLQSTSLGNYSQLFRGIISMIKLFLMLTLKTLHLYYYFRAGKNWHFIVHLQARSGTIWICLRKTCGMFAACLLFLISQKAVLLKAVLYSTETREKLRFSVFWNEFFGIILLKRRILLKLYLCNVLLKRFLLYCWVKVDF